LLLCKVFYDKLVWIRAKSSHQRTGETDFIIKQLITKPIIMNKTAKIIIGILVLVCGFFILVAQIKASEAEKLVNEAQKLQQENQLIKAEAERQAELALRRTTEALEAQYEARTALEQLGKCENSK
jgi:hypothetical protein